MLTVPQVLGATSTSSGGPLQSSAFGSAVTNGSTIIVTIGTYGGFPTAVSDTAGNTYAEDARKSASPGDPDMQVSVWRAANVVGGSSFKITVTAPASFITIVAIEVASQENSSPLDGAGSTNIAAGGQAPSTGTFSTTNADDIIIVTFATGAGSWAGGNLPSGYTLIGQETGGGLVAQSSAYKIVAATQTSINPTWGANVGYFAPVIALAYKAAAGGGIPATPWFYLLHNQCGLPGGF